MFTFFFIYFLDIPSSFPWLNSIVSSFYIFYRIRIIQKFKAVPLNIFFYLEKFMAS